MTDEHTKALEAGRALANQISLRSADGIVIVRHDKNTGRDAIVVCAGPGWTAGRHIPATYKGFHVEIQDVLDATAHGISKSQLDRERAGLLQDAEGIAAVDRGETVDWDTAMKRIDAAIDRGVAAYEKRTSDLSRHR